MKKIISRSPFTYSVVFPRLLGIIPGETIVTKYMQIQMDSDFLVREQVLSTGERNPLMLHAKTVIKIKDLASGKLYVSGDGVPLDSQFGSANFPYRIPLGGRMFYRGQVIEVEMSFLPGAPRCPEIFMSFIGEKLFTRG